MKQHTPPSPTGNAAETRREDGSETTVAQVPVDTQSQPRRVLLGHIRWRGIFAAFQHRNYRLFFAGHGISLIGTWMQMVAEGWLVYQLSNSALTLGIVRFLHTLPVTAFTLLGGAVADRFEKRRILVVTQSSSMVLAFTMFVLVYFEVIQVWQVGVLALLLGVANAFDIPARQSFVVEMVGRKDLMNAIALNSTVFNGARIVGPAVAGLLIALTGLAGCFLINSLSYFAAIGSYSLMRLPAHRPAENQQDIRAATAEAFRYVLGNRTLRAVMIMVCLCSLFGMPYTMLMPIFARDVLGLEASGYGYLMAANGIGAFTGAVTLATLGDYPHKRRLVFGGAVGLSVMLVIFARSTNPILSAIALVAAGWFMIIFFATANTVVQLRTPDALRGRVMGIYSLSFIGSAPLGSLIAGVLARWTDAPTTTTLGAMVCLLSALVTWHVLRKESDGAPPPQASTKLDPPE